MASTPSATAPDMKSFSDQLDAYSQTNFGTKPSYSDAMDFTVMEKVTDGGNNDGWQMKGQIGTAKMYFGGKNYPVLYYTLQVAKNSAINNANTQVWIQFKHMDNKAETALSFYNVSTLFACSGTTAAFTCTATDTISCGAVDLLTGIKSPATNKGPSCTNTQKIFNRDASFNEIGYSYTESQNGWSTLQVGGYRNFVE